MKLAVELVTLGSKALDALRLKIDDAKCLDPLSLVTVFVPTSSTGLGTRRLLASGDVTSQNSRSTLDTSRSGLVNTTFTTVERWMDDITGPYLVANGKRSPSNAALHCAVRKALEDHAGPLLSPVRSHPATVRALVEDLHELSGIPDPTLEGLRGQSERANEVVSILVAARSLLSNWYTEADLESAALTMLIDSPETVRSRTGTLVLYLPTRLSPRYERFICEYAKAEKVSMILGLTGDTTLDEYQMHLARRFDDMGDTDSVCTARHLPVAATPVDGSDGHRRPSDRYEALTSQVSRVVSAPAPDVEILTCLRSLMERNKAGVPLERMAIVYPRGDTYAPALMDALLCAEIPFNGQGIDPLASTVPGRFILGLLELSDDGWEREAVGSWMSGLPITFDGRLIPGSDWNRMSKEAGILTGSDHWIHQLKKYAHAQFIRDDEPLERDHGREGIDHGRDRSRVSSEADKFLAFMTSLFARFDSLPDTWPRWSTWAKSLLADYLEVSMSINSWPERDTQAYIEISNSLVDLSRLEEINPHPTLDDFRSLITYELSQPTPQVTRFGVGVHIGTVEEMVGLRYDTVFLLGMMDQCYSSRAREDPLLPDRERSAVHEEFPLRASRSIDVERALASTILFSDEQVLSFSRGDFRQRSEYRPSRLVLNAIGKIGGYDHRLYSSDLSALAEIDGFEVIPSFHAALARSGEPFSKDDYDVRSALRHCISGRNISDHAMVKLDSGLSRSLEARYARRSRSFTRFDGLVGPGLLDTPSSRLTFSASALESYFTCPRSYLFKHLLQIDTPEDRDFELTINPLVRGALIHEILFKAVSMEIGLGEDSFMSSGGMWTQDGVERMREIAEKEFTCYEDRRLTGHPFFWSIEKEKILRVLDRFVETDNELRSRLKAVPVLLEYNFGNVDTQVSFEVNTGTSVRFRGRVDRIDRCDDGSVVVADYKTGTIRSSINDSDVTDSGRSLQLPIYALAARSIWPSASIKAFYWQLGNTGGKNSNVSSVRDIVEIDEGALGQFGEVLDVVCSGIDSGLFPANPGSQSDRSSRNCTYCSFNSICPNTKFEEWELKQRDPALRRYVDTIAFREVKSR